MSRARWIVVLIVAAALVAGFFLFDVRAAIEGVLAFIERLGAWGPALFVLIFIALLVALFVPGA